MVARGHHLGMERMPDGMQASCSPYCTTPLALPYQMRRAEGRRVRHRMMASEQPALEASVSAQEPPWAFGFQLNERCLNWDQAGHMQLLKLLCAEKLEKDLEWVDGQVDALRALLPDMTSKLGSMKADLFVQMIANTELLAERMARLREFFPRTNVSALVSKLPALALEHDPEDLSRRFGFLSDALSKRTDVEFLVAREPALLLCATSTDAVTELLDTVKRLLPVGDPVNFLISNPSLVLDMEATRLPSAIDLTTE